MQKVLRYFLMTVLAFCVYVPGMCSMAEAASVVVLPLISNVDYPDLESTYYDNVIDCVKQQGAYELLDNDAITAIIDESTAKGVLPDEQALKNIANKSGADLVVAFELNKLSLEPIQYRHDYTCVFSIDGYCSSFDVNENKYKKHRFKYSDELDMGFYTRQNVQLRFWARQVQREMHRVLKDKGLHIEKPKFTKF